ncbi:hypothetical protein NAT65_22610, partial [Achromobacter xylosoxidans]|uniref:hypothetical protein n=1 Tax=Alcaligenes xylosoxydans xylosoxydans TaxID=85698 RepID=UPI00203FA261
DPAHRTPSLIDAAIRSLKTQADKDGAEQALKDLVTHGVSVQRIAPAEILAGGQQRAGDGKTREALSWYAEKVAGCRKFGPDGEAARHALDRDGGQLARAALSAPQAEQGFTACVFDGPAPDGYASWYAWCTTPVKSGAFIRAARVDDWNQPTEDGGAKL